MAGMTWYLVFMTTLTYLGPMTQDDCTRGRSVFQSAVCRQAAAYTTCPVPGHPGTGMVCPDFDYTPPKK